MTDDGPADVLRLDGEGGIATLTLDRPKARNALDRRLTAALGEALAALAGRRDLRALVLTGEGERAFCAGADLVERRGMSPDERGEHTAAINAVADALARFPVPV